MDTLDWGVEAVTVPKDMISTGLNPSREIEHCAKDSSGETLASSVEGNTVVVVPREPKSLAEKYGLQAMMARLGDVQSEKSAKLASIEKTAIKKMKKCAPV